ncbi:NAD(P)/FAD-dependent oxidoreductase [Kitasatospora viridis]|uniref:Flavin-dependent dehydrogenase n=1 Tax=Kitasatospora viridis TaxID=281105 RepID=A0A561T6R5_9ACTN|nr:FAD-dependent monooxygenase [Kitasatospora viridis]TWF82811.1 flavin-dependent dehydrogenase [Kitasatospora viridis]
MTHPYNNHRTDAPRTAGQGRVVVIGAGFAGLLAATVLSRHAAEVVVLERDRLPDGPRPRSGLPQAHHGHLLMAAGAAALDDLLPGLTDSLAAAGARRLAMPDDVLTLTPHGWLPRTGEASHGWSLSRDLLDWTLRRRVAADAAIRLRPGLRVDGLRGDGHRVTGVQVRGHGAPDGGTIRADLVVDATGRGSRAAHWLTALGLPQVAEETVDSGLVYATLPVRAPVADFPAVAIQPVPGTGPGRAGVVFPIEDGQWLVTLSATRGRAAPADLAEFRAFARGLPHPVIADLLAAARPLGEVRRFGNTADRRLRYDRLRGWPRGFVVVGDAVARTNPAYGHGMSVAATGLQSLARLLERDGADPGTLGGEAQRALLRSTRAAWTLATAQDIHVPDVRGALPTRADRLSARLADRLLATAARADGGGGAADGVLAALIRLGTLEGGPGELAGPLLRTLLPGRGPAARPPRHPGPAPAGPPGEPPLTERELCSLGPGFRPSWRLVS